MTAVAARAFGGLSHAATTALAEAGDVALFAARTFARIGYRPVRARNFVYQLMQSGVRSLPMTMMVMFVAPLAGRLSGKIGPRYQMTVGMLMMTAGLLVH